MTSADGSQVIGWVVRWHNPDPTKPIHAVTVWCGQYQKNKKNEEVISTQWLLTEATDFADDWESTLIGNDLFKRTPPPKELVELRSQTAPRPFPKV